MSIEDFDDIDDLLNTEDKKTKQNEELLRVTRLFRKVFDTPDGNEVLGIILEDLHYFAPCETEAARTLNNYAKFLMSNRLGINNHKEIVDALMSLQKE